MKNDEFSSELLEFGGMMKKGYSYVANNAGRIIAVITAAVAALVTFTDVALAGFGAKDFTATLAVMLISSYIMYFSLEEAGERLGEESEEYKTATERYKAARARIGPEDIKELRSFCTRYANEELSYRRAVMLAELGATEEDLISHAASSKRRGGRWARLRRIAKEKPVRLTPSLLLCAGTVSRKSELASPVGRKIVTMLGELLPTTVCMLFTASVILTAKSDLGVCEIIEGALKLAALPIAGFRGYSTGYAYAKGDGAAWLETKARLLETFIRQRDAVK